MLLCIASFCFQAASVTTLSRVIRTPWQEDSFIVRWYYYYFAGFYASFYLVPASAGSWLRVSVEGSQGHDWAVHSEVLNLCGQKMGMEIIQSSSSVLTLFFLCVVKGFRRLNENKSVTNRTCCIRQRVMALN